MLPLQSSSARQVDTVPLHVDLHVYSHVLLAPHTHSPVHLMGAAAVLAQSQVLVQGIAAVPQAHSISSAKSRMGLYRV